MKYTLSPTIKDAHKVVQGVEGPLDLECENAALHRQGRAKNPRGFPALVLAGKLVCQLIRPLDPSPHLHNRLLADHFSP